MKSEKVNRLKPETKILIVQCLAKYMTPTQAQQAVKAEFGVDVTLPQVVYYDPTKGPSDKKLNPALRTLFEETRQAFRKLKADHAIADIGYRLGRLQRMSERAEQMGNISLAAQLIEQAAKDEGGQFTNKLKVRLDNKTDKRAELAKLVGKLEDELPEPKPLVM